YDRRVLNLQHQRAYEALGLEAGDKKKSKAKAGEKAKDQGQDAEPKAKDPKAMTENTARARKWMCQQFYDIRAFGAVMTTGVNCGQVGGPVQITFARSIDPIVPMEFAITRKSVTTEEDAAKQSQKDGSITGTMGRKNTVPYALYRCHGFVNPYLAADTGFTY